MAYSPFVLPFLISGVILLAVSFYALSRRNLPFIFAYATLMLVASFGAFIYSLEVISVEVPFKVFLLKLNISSTLVIVLCLLAIILRLSGLSRWLSPGRFAVFLIEPLAVLSIVFFPGATHLFAFGYHLDPAGPVPSLLFSMGPLYWIHIAYTYVLLAAAIVFLARSLRDFQPALRSQTLLFVIAMLLPFAGNMLYHSGLTIPRGVDWTSAAFAFTGVLTAVALFRSRLADVAPVSGSMIARTMHDMAVVVDSRSRVLDFNPSALAAIGPDARRAVGRTFEELPAPWNAALRPYADAVSLTDTIRVDLRDRTRWYHLSVSRLQGESGIRASGRLFLLHDVTEREEVEEHLRESEARFRGFIEQSFEGIILFDEEGRVIEFNPSSEKLTGLLRAEVLGMSAWQLMSTAIASTMRVPGDEAFLEAEVLEALRTGRGDLINRAIDATLQRPDGTIRHLRQYFFPIRTAKGFRFGGISHDVTEAREAEQALRRSEEQLQQSQKMEAVGRLAGGIAHDFNNILTVISGYCDMLSEAADEGRILKGPIAEVSRAAERASRLTAQLLAFSRKQVLQPRILSLNTLVRAVEGILARVIGEDVELVTRLHPAAGNIQADSGQVEQVIVNLAVNARDAMPAGGTLTLETVRDIPGADFLRDHPEMRPGHYVRLSVVDTGVGMRSDIVPRIFEPFFTTKEDGKGTGLGLSTSYGIIKQSNGYIYCTSAPSRGTTFSIYFPLASEEEPAERALPSARTSLRGTETILVVEDEDSVRGYVRALLEKNGYTVLDAAGGAEAIAAVADGGAGVSLMITDVVMPRMSGRELAEKILALCPGMRLLYVSGFTDDSIVHHGVTTQAINFIQKPFRAEDFLRKVREILTEHS